MPRTAKKHLFAPESAFGEPQIIPTAGPHDQIFVRESVLRSLVFLGLVEYAPDYGPNAHVYRPVGNVTSEEVRSWLAEEPSSVVIDENAERVREFLLSSP